MSNPYTHLTLQDRIIIAAGISNGSSKTAIADTIGKDKSTVGKEIRLHRFLKYKCRLPRECAAYKKCPSDRNCTPDCPDFVPFRCRRRDRTPGACNGCSRYSGCRFNKYWYNPQDAEKDYRSTLVDTRTGVNMTAAEAKEKHRSSSRSLTRDSLPMTSFRHIPNWICRKRHSTPTLSPAFFTKSTGSVPLT